MVSVRSSVILEEPGLLHREEPAKVVKIHLDADAEQQKRQIFTHCHSYINYIFQFCFIHSFSFKNKTFVFAIQVPDSKRDVKLEFKSWIVHLIMSLWRLFGLDHHHVLQLQIWKFRLRL